MKQIIFVADFFLEQGVNGGAEICNDELINLLEESGYTVKKINCENLRNHIFKKNNFYIIANFMKLSEDCKKTLSLFRYIIYEHDHKYVSTNDPSKFVNMVIPFNKIINKSFYEKAEAVLCQSIIHSKVLQKNLLLKNIINTGGNFWSEEKLQILEKHINKNKTIKNAILYSMNKNKGMQQTIDFCNKNKIEFELIKPCNYENFINQLSQVENLLFFPQWLETFNRVCIEAKILGCKITTNRLIGCSYEPWFRQHEGTEMIKFLRFKKKEIYNVFVSLIENLEVEFLEEIPIPKISIITSLYKGGKYIEHFMSEVTRQTVFNKCELIIIDANSPDGEEKVIREYMNKYDNIFYEKLDETLSVQETMNIAIKKSTGEILTLWNADDNRDIQHIETMTKFLISDPLVDLVYSDCYLTTKINETLENNSSENKMYEHSIYNFSKENMIKCLPGPMPIWKKSMTDKIGLFDENLKYAGDWEMWLRCVDAGFRFKKIPFTKGLYYQNPEGISTSIENHDERFQEESSIFNKYKHIFGDRVYNSFKGYFNG
jgi:GT2 family glycosyltransferase